MHNLKFPSSLKKLILEGSRLQWEDMTMIGSLPYLEVLKLEFGSVNGPEWKPVEGEFIRLKMLKIHCVDLIYWNADNFHFPVLEELVLGSMSELEEIPLGIGEIPTLKLICLYYCSESSVISAMRIVEEQESLGNEGLRVLVEFWDEGKLESFWAKVEPESFRSDNFQVRATL
ncbi:late blight resistance protein r1-a [Phtheirospermum japonicum]|uniref:Late blight resistance protein r1-a n=1 Tax=Phtheirospermum japonicum TaxID=374723 RepID=A0A830D1G5_9LAMI|nr:late blight resistance protein r1-a [Phtheirospermum japonicum]